MTELYGDNGLRRSIARQAADWRRRGASDGGVVFLGDAADVLDSLLKGDADV